MRRWRGGVVLGLPPLTSVAAPRAPPSSHPRRHPQHPPRRPHCLPRAVLEAKAAGPGDLLDARAAVPEDLHDTRAAAPEPFPKPAPPPPITSSTSEPPPPRPSGHLRRRCPPAPPRGSRPSVLSGIGTHAATTARGQAAPTRPYDEHDYSIRIFTGHSASVMSLDFHPNKDDLICSCDGDNEIRFWSIKHGNVVRIFKGGSAQLRFQPRYGGYLATASDNVVSILDVETQTCVRRFESHTKGVDSVFWDPTGEYVVSVSEDSVKVWSLNDESFVNELNCSGRKFTSFSGRVYNFGEISPKFPKYRLFCRVPVSAIELYLDIKSTIEDYVRVGNRL
ncbi:unnamed protein product [Miscanthus lutarioriparius]|uniref:Uncharacterized protein n=1 Tax=Miscanthus lutarioriparius TaxID=422564 RepID=A0A811RJU0_9POAL|nr:unnamed protein product [Miscanthus lutarioriparius]